MPRVRALARMQKRAVNLLPSSMPQFLPFHISYLGYKTTSSTSMAIMKGSGDLILIYRGISIELKPMPPTQGTQGLLATSRLSPSTVLGGIKSLRKAWRHLTPFA